MKKDLQIIYFLLIAIAGFLFLLAIIPKQKIFLATIFIQEFFNEYNEKENEVFLLSDEKINIDLIESIIIETNQGYIKLKSSSLSYTDTFIKIDIKNISTLKYPNNNVLIYAENTSILGFLFSNLV